MGQNPKAADLERGFRLALKLDIAVSVLGYEIRVAMFYGEEWLQAANVN